MDYILFIKGLLVGIGVSIPLGPMAMIVVQRTLNKGRRVGLLSGIGVGASDITYALLAGFGLSAVIGFILQYQDMFKFVGAFVLIIYGIKLFFDDPVKARRKELRRRKPHNALSSVLSMYFLSFANPAALLILLGAFAGFGLVKESTELHSIIFIILGVGVGALSWWFSLTLIVNSLRKRIRLRHLLWLNRIAGVAIVVLGIVAVVSVFTTDIQMAV